MDQKRSLLKPGGNSVSISGLSRDLCSPIDQNIRPTNPVTASEGIATTQKNLRAGRLNLEAATRENLPHGARQECVAWDWKIGEIEDCQSASERRLRIRTNNCPTVHSVNIFFESTINTLPTFQQPSNLPICQCRHLPVQLQSELHLPRRIGLCGDLSKIGVVEVRERRVVAEQRTPCRSEHNPIEDVEGLRADVQTELL
jgi:hypothetical protein